MVCIFFLIEKNKNRFVFISSYGLKWIQKNSETLIGFKKSKSGFDTNTTNPSLSISIHFRLLGDQFRLLTLMFTVFER